jgi:hypothetical protein
MTLSIYILCNVYMAHKWLRPTCRPIFPLLQIKWLRLPPPYLPTCLPACLLLRPYLQHVPGPPPHTGVCRNSLNLSWAPAFWADPSFTLLTVLEPLLSSFASKRRSPSGRQRCPRLCRRGRQRCPRLCRRTRTSLHTKGLVSESAILTTPSHMPPKSTSNHAEPRAAYPLVLCAYTETLNIRKSHMNWCYDANSANI